ncbi:class I SAM-dependent methyltransferase [Pseudonocardiaceae bacterium YIM PH 21723]|nr:class I SAM-dependent methyltransferase [Pseudonocardiaceae bacterium YIM PH 21723]
MDLGLVEQYTDGLGEGTRLVRTPHGRLEFVRTQELVRRVMPAGARVLDVGGATGVHAEWLAWDGHSVHVIDVVPGHVDAARELPGVTAEVGDARDLPIPDDSVDVVLLFGPLYHLVDPLDRVRVLAEARRVLVAGGLLICAGISRYLSAMETGSDGTLSADLAASVDAVIRTGTYDGHVGFMSAHFHTAGELQTELEAAGLSDVAVYGIEGPAWPALDAAGLAAFDGLLDAAARCARLVERDPLLINASAHLLGVATSQPAARAR